MSTYHIDTAVMTPEIAAILRGPFDPRVIGKLPRVSCRDCAEVTKANRRKTACPRHQMVRCEQCHNWITSGHMHLDYVGHAETTDRLLQADPGWTWEPVAFGADGLPLLDRHNGLWIRLTVAGVTRLGYGHPDGKDGPDAIKEAIGDAIRNAAMRFGVALDLWGATFKGDDDDQGDQTERPAPVSQATAEILELIRAADNREELTAVWNLLRGSAKAGRLAPADSDRLNAEWCARRDALAAQQPAEVPA